MGKKNQVRNKSGREKRRKKEEKEEEEGKEGKKRGKEGKKPLISRGWRNTLTFCGLTTNKTAHLVVYIFSES